VTGITEMRKGMDSLSAHVQTALSEDPFGGQLLLSAAQLSLLLEDPNPAGLI
jgi:hypothetical protein